MANKTFEGFDLPSRMPNITIIMHTLCDAEFIEFNCFNRLEKCKNCLFNINNPKAIEVFKRLLKKI